MTSALKRVFLIGLLSQALLFCTLFAICSGLPVDGHKLVIAFVLTALALVLVTYFGALAASAKWRQRLMLLGMVILLLGLLALWFASMQTHVSPYSLLLAFVVLGFFLLRRMVQLVEDLAYIRRSLLDQYTVDILLIVAAAILLLFIAKDPDWERPTIPLFVSFLLARMVALSLAAQLNKEEHLQKSLMEKFQNRLPYLLIGVALLGGWMVVSVGGNFFFWMFTPIFGLVGHLVQGLMTHLGFLIWIKIWINELNAWFLRLLCQMGICGGNPMSAPHAVGSRPPTALPQTASWLWLKILGGAVVVISLGSYLFLKLRKIQLPQYSANGMEVRQFLHKEPAQKKAQTKAEVGSLSRMRRLYRKFLFAMQKAGYVRGAGETAMELVLRISCEVPGMREDGQELTAYYMRERYGENTVEQEQTRAEELVEKWNGKRGK